VDNAALFPDVETATNKFACTSSYTGLPNATSAQLVDAGNVNGVHVLPFKL
jgi:hypothetical protein